MSKTSDFFKSSVLANVPVGLALPWFGLETAIPTGYVPLYGSLLLVSDYPDLFAVLGTTYGGDGVVNFGLPDMRGRVAMGLDNMGGSAAGVVVAPNGSVLGGKLGEETHTLTVAEMPEHSHDIQGWANTDTTATKVTTKGNDTPTVVSTDLTGGDEAHQNVQPSMAIFWIMKAVSSAPPIPVIVGGFCSTYTGTGAIQSIGGYPFEPDLVWVKGADIVSDHYWFDVGGGATAYLRTNTTLPESVDANSLTAFLPDGFSLGAPFNGLNQLDKNYWALCLKQESGFFDTLTYVGDAIYGKTIGHSLGVAPEMIIVKSRTLEGQPSNWWMFWAPIGNSNSLRLNDTSIISINSTNWAYFTPTPTVFKVAGNDEMNRAGRTHSAYLFASKAGKSKVGMYTGDTTGGNLLIPMDFKPSFFMVKNGDAPGKHWIMNSTCYDPVNPHEHYLKADDDTFITDLGTPILNFNNDGVEIITTNPSWNETGSRFFYIAIA